MHLASNLKKLFFSKRMLSSGIFLAVGFAGLVSTAQTERASAQPIRTKKLIILGDSLTEGFGVARESAFPSLLEKKILKQGKTWVVVNSGVSGSTTASLESRLDWQIRQKPDLLILALGANDGLRGFDIQVTEKNLSQAIVRLKNSKVEVILAGMQMPPNYGKKYTQEFKEIFPRLAKKFDLKLIPFLLEGVAGQKDLNLADGIHPNERGHEVIAENVYQVIRGNL